jgi:hypothetical protein
MGRNIIVALFFLASALGGSSCATQYTVSTAGRLSADSVFYRNDSLKTKFYFGHYNAQYGFTPIDRYARRILSYCEIDSNSDVILFSGHGLFCIERYSVPSYLLSDEELSYQEFSLLEEKENDRTAYIGDVFYRFQNRSLGKYPEEIVNVFKETKITRNVQVFRGKRMVITEDLIPYKGHYISMIYITKEFRRGTPIDKLHTWAGGNVFYDPTAPNQMLNRQKGWIYDRNLRMTRENGMRLYYELLR